MFLLIAVFLSLIMHFHRTGGGFLRFNNPDHITAPLDLDDLKPGSYDDLLKYNPSLGAPYEDISYGGNERKAFDWTAPEIEVQNIELVLEPKELPTDAKEVPTGAKEVPTDAKEVPLDAKKDVSVDMSLPFLVQRSINGKKSFYVLVNQNQQQDSINSTINHNVTDKREVRFSAMVDPDTRRRSKSYSTLVVYDSALSKSKPKYRTYSITTPKNELTGYGFNYATGSYADHDYTLEGQLVSSCYRCGELNYGKWWRPSVEKRERDGKILPRSILCSEVFGDNWEYKTKARYLRSKCYDNKKQKYDYEIGADNYHFYHECVNPLEYKFGRNHTLERGNPVECFGRYTGRCFKRFLDVGKEYTERGCASWPPHQSNSFASHRFTKMEYLLHSRDNACVSSPLASLTPFARGVSLYVRYHVCVCKGKYCNDTGYVAASPLLLLFTTFISIKLYS